MFIKRIITTLTTTLLFLSILKADVDSSFYDIKITIRKLKQKKRLWNGKLRIKMTTIYYFANKIFIQ